MVDRKLIASGILEALEDADREYRARWPRIFRRVDAHKCAPFRRPQKQTDPDLRYQVRECGWCGDWFVAAFYRGGWVECCGQRCAHDLRAFRQRRAKEGSA